MPVRTWLLFGLAVVGLVGIAAPSWAQFRGERIKIQDARVGLPPGRFVGERDSGRSTPIVKRNTWVPIYLDLELVKEVKGGLLLRVEASDADNLRTRVIYPLLKNVSDQLPGARLSTPEFGYMAYVRCGDLSGEVKLTVLSDDSDNTELSGPKIVQYLQFRDVATYVVLSLGSKLPGFDLPAEKTANQNASTRTGLRNGRVETSAMTNVREMPDQWFGYQAVDLVVLGTGSTTGEFLDELFDKEKSRDFKPRRDALLEWVRRGGKLVISVGSKSAQLVQSEFFRDLIPATLSPNEPSRSIDVAELRWITNGVRDTANLEPRAGKFPVARLLPNPKKPSTTLIADSKLNPDDTPFPLVVQAPLGLGRVTVVAFDLDQSPFLDLPKKAEFWDWMLRNAGSDRASLAPTGSSNTTNYNYGYSSDSDDEFATALREHVERFDGVPVISFGWVALFIVLYTLLIGPVEYFILKKILGRLELTWITFPLIVLTVSATAYFTAYAIKGKDLKINKIDIVDVDLAGGRIYGQTYFTIFSPRIDSYTLSVEPRSEWSNPKATEPSSPLLIDWMGGGRGGGGSGGLLSRGYNYTTDLKDGSLRTGEGLVRVPIQVWSTKAFTANWSAALDRAAPLVVAEEEEHNLYHPPGDPDTLAGSFKNQLPIGTLTDAVLFYGGTAYKLPTLTPGQTVGVVTARGGDRAGALQVVDDWAARNATPAFTVNRNPYGGRGGTAEIAGPSTMSLWGMLFHEYGLSAGARLQNASLRHLDQSWRLKKDNKNEAILLARVDAPSGSASESVLTDPTGPAVTKLWLKGLPGNPEGRQPIPGTIRQETYLRVYIPIRPATPKK